MNVGRKWTWVIGAVIGLGVGTHARAQGLSADVTNRELPIVLPQTTAASPTFEITLDQAVQRALENNLDIAVERLNPATVDFTIASIEGNYRPTVVSTIGQNNQVQLPTNQLTGGTSVKLDQTTYNFGVTQNMPWKGGNFVVNWNNRRQDTSNLFNTSYNPQYNSTFQAVFTQPLLLRNFSTDATRTQLRVTLINREISEVQLRATITTTLANVRNAYWDLVFVGQAVDVAKRSLELAQKLVEDNRVRVEVGTMAQIDVVQAEAEAANRRLALAQVEAQAKTAQLALKRLIVNGTNDPMWPASLNPLDRPSPRGDPIDIDAAIRNALASRTDIDISRRTLDSNNINLNQLRNQTLPTLNLVGTYSLQGIGGMRFQRDAGLGTPITGTIPGGFLDALQLIGNRDYPNWNLQVQLSYPIGTSTADAQYARGRINLQQNRAEIKALELQIATEVSNAAVQVQSTVTQVEASRAARELAQARLEAEESKFEVGLSTNFFVVQAQRDLADAQINELRALLDHEKALVDFERLQQTSSSGPGITIVNTGGAGNVGTGGTGGTGGTQGNQ